MEADEKNLLLILNEVREMNRLQRENIKSIDLMSEQINYYQNYIDSIFVNRWNTNPIIREIRIDLLRLKILADPNIAGMYRSSKKKSFIVKSLLSSGLDKSLLTTYNPEETLTNTKQPESFYLTSTGLQSIEPNSYLLVELANPLGSSKSVYLSTFLGGGLSSTEIEIILDGSIRNLGTLMTVRNADTALENNSIAIARLSIEGIESMLEGKVVLSLIQKNKMTIMDLNSRLFVAPGHSLIVRLMNRAKRTNFVSVNLSWWE